MLATVVIPTIRGREDLLCRAVDSVRAQTLPCRLIVELDEDLEGAALTRNRALARVDTDWVAFLDDDDLLKPFHLKACLRFAWLSKADVVYPSYDTVGVDPVDCHGIPFSPALLRRRNFIPITTVCRTDLVRQVGGFRPHPDELGNQCEDWGLWLALLDMGAKFAHLAQRTWVWDLGGDHVHRHPSEEAAGVTG